MSTETPTLDEQIATLLFPAERAEQVQEVDTARANGIYLAAVAPRFSSNMVYAWWVVEAMGKLGYITDLSNDEKGSWLCQFEAERDMGGSAREFVAVGGHQGGNAAEAICRAALAALDAPA